MSAAESGRNSPSPRRSSVTRPAWAWSCSGRDFGESPAGVSPAQAPAVDRIESDHGADKFGAAGAKQPPEADNLAGAQREADVGELVAAREAFDLEDDLRFLGAIRREADLVLDRAHHLMDHVARRHRADVAAEHRLAVPHHRNPLADAENLVDEVGDVDDRYAFLLQAANDLEQALPFALRQATKSARRR